MTEPEMTELEFQQEMLKRLEWLAMMFVGPAVLMTVYWMAHLVLLMLELIARQG